MHSVALAEERRVSATRSGLRMAGHLEVPSKFYAAFETEEVARNFESHLKSGSGHAFAKRHLGL